MNASDLRPRGDRLLVRPLRNSEMSEETVGGIVLPEQTQARQRYRQWEIVAVGEDVMDETLAPGLRILCDQYSGTPFEIDREEFAFIGEEKVSAILLAE